MAAPEFIYLVKPGVANPIRRTIPSAVGWIALGWQLADPDDAQWFVDPPAEPAVDVMTRDELDTAVADLQAGLSATVAALKAWAKNPDQLVAGAVTYSSGLLATAAVQWPDGLPGVLTITSRHASTGAVTGYTITRVDGATTTTYTQPTITRDSLGNATLVPQITVA